MSPVGIRVMITRAGAILALAVLFFIANAACEATTANTSLSDCKNAMRKQLEEAIEVGNAIPTALRPDECIFIGDEDMETIAFTLLREQVEKGNQAELDRIFATPSP